MKADEKLPSVRARLAALDASAESLLRVVLPDRIQKRARIERQLEEARSMFEGHESRPSRLMFVLLVVAGLGDLAFALASLVVVQGLTPAWRLALAVAATCGLVLAQRQLGRALKTKRLVTTGELPAKLGLTSADRVLTAVAGGFLFATVAGLTTIRSFFLDQALVAQNALQAATGTSTTVHVPAVAANGVPEWALLVLGLAASSVALFVEYRTHNPGRERIDELEGEARKVDKSLARTVGRLERIAMDIDRGLDRADAVKSFTNRHVDLSKEHAFAQLSIYGQPTVELARLIESHTPPVPRDLFEVNQTLVAARERRREVSTALADVAAGVSSPSGAETPELTRDADGSTVPKLAVAGLVRGRPLYSHLPYAAV